MPYGRVGIHTGNRAGVRLKQTLFCSSGSEFAPNRPCFAPAGRSLPQTDPVLHQRAGVRLKQTLFCSSGLEFVSNRLCFAPAGRSSSQTDSVLLQRVGVRPKQTLFCISGSEFVPNRPCFAPAGRRLFSNRPCFAPAGGSSFQTDPVLLQRVGVRLKQTLFCTTECQRSKTKLLIVSAHNFYDASTHCIR